MLSREDLIVVMPMDYSPTVVFFKQSDLDLQHFQLLLDCFRSMDVVLNKMLEDWQASNEVPKSYLELHQVCKDFMANSIFSNTKVTKLNQLNEGGAMCGRRDLGGP